LNLPAVEKDRKFVEALSRGLDVLRAFVPGEMLLGNQEIARRTGLPKATVTRLTYTLTRLGYLDYSERQEKYQLGTGVLALGFAYVSSLMLRQIARPLMQGLAERTDAAVGLLGRDRLEMIYIENSRPHHAETLRLEVGAQIPMATTAAGRAYLAELGEKDRDYYLGRLQLRHGDKWPGIRQEIEVALCQYEALGFVASLGDWERSVNSAGVALKTSEGRIFSFNCGGPAFRIKAGDIMESVGPQLVHFVQSLNAMLVRI
jgi:DNA-binding IclR family transcriptional regulator